MKVNATYKNGDEKEATVGPRAQVEVERRFGLLFTDAIDGTTGKARFEYIYCAAWAALHFSGQEPEADYDTWLAGIADVDVTYGTPASNPTRRARRPAKSSS